ncbi:hypothetical protein ACOME3_005468 [Neoechinorhynchus agilis]
MTFPPTEFSQDKSSSNPNTVDPGVTFDSTWWIASLLSVPLAKLIEILDHFGTSSYNKIDSTNNSIPQSFVRCHLAKELYERLFIWVSRAINRSLDELSATSNVSRNSLMLVDIPLINIAQTNSFNGLCLNFLNEKLHQIFIRNEIVDIQSICESEMDTDLERITPNISLNILELFENPSNGILNQHLTRNPANDARTFIDRVGLYCKRSQNNFIISHFGKPIVYRFTDVLFDDGGVSIAVDDLMKQSSNKYIQQIWNIGDQNRSSRGIAFLRIHNAYYHLLNKLQGRDLFYLRCIDPFRTQETLFVDQNVAMQLQAYNIYEQALVLDLCKIQRYQHLKDFVQRYKMLSPVRNTMFALPVDPSTMAINALEIVKSYNLVKSIFIGKSYAFFQDEESFYTLEGNRACDMENIVIVLQSAFRSWYQRRLTIKEEAATVIGRWYRMATVRKYFQALLEANLNTENAKSITGPRVPAILGKSIDDFARIFLRWQALNKSKQQLKSYTRIIELREIGCKILLNRPNFMITSFGQIWKGNYLADMSHMDAFMYVRKMHSLKLQDSFNEILFSSNAIKMNSRVEEDYRSLVFTDRSVYKLDPVKKFIVKKRPIPIREFIGIDITGESDQLAVLRSARQHDLVFHLDTNPLGGDRICELVCTLCYLYSKRDIPFKVNIVKFIKANFERDSYIINLVPGDRVAFKKSGTMVLMTTPTCAKIT